jgi:chorismate-pyruvate lyase
MLALAAALLATTASASPWSDGSLQRVEALAILQTLNADLLSHDSATLTLDRWCATHRLASPATILAERVHGVDKPATPEIRAALKVSADAPVGYRHVRLRCGAHVLSEADNWYVPGRLTADMNRALDSSDIAFGRAVQALHFTRHTLSATLLWSPLPEDWEMQGLPGVLHNPTPMSIPEHVLEHRAMLSLPDGTPISLVVEDYTADVLAFPPPR